MNAFFLNFEFFHPFWKNQNSDFFSNNSFLMRVSDNLSAYSYYECLQLKKTRSVPQETEQKTLGEINFEIPPYVNGHTSFRQAQVFGSSGVKTKHL